MTDQTAQQTLIAALLDPGRYPHPAKKVRLVETHISWVMLAGRYAYKIKKALDLGFLDYTTLEARRFYCSEEMRLNRRLAPQLYLDVMPIGGSPDRPQFDARPAIEYAVKMRRFPSTRLMDRMLQAGKIGPQHIDSLAATLARFHNALPAIAADSGDGSVESIRDAAMQNFETQRSLMGDEADASALDALQQATIAAYEAGKPLFVERRAQGFVRECHGDLHLGNIVLIGDEPVPFDGIEFNPDLRWIDVMSEAAFTMMDLLYRQQPHMAFRFINGYLEATGDYAGVAVLRYYLAYRATVRAKVGAIRARQPGLSRRARENESSHCRSHLALAMQCLTQLRPALIITHGLPGSGKSTFAQMALERFGAIRIRSDVERKRLFGLDALDSSRSGAGAGIYGADATRKTYARLRQLAHDLLAAGFPVIVDAAFLRQEERNRFHELAQGMGVPFIIASIQAGESAMRTRIVQRHAQQQDASEAGLAVLKLLQNAQERLAAPELAHMAEFSNGNMDELANSRGWDKLKNLWKR